MAFCVGSCGLIKYLIALLVLAGCGASNPVADVKPSGGMLGLQAEQDPTPWRSADVLVMADRPSLEGWVIFDARGVEDPTTRELTWQAINAMLMGYSEPSMRMVQAELEPGEDVVWDLYFLVNLAAEREGVLWRMSRAQTPGELVLNVLVERQAGVGVPERVSLWVSTGVSEPTPASLRYEAQEECRTYFASGISVPSIQAEDDTCQLAHDLLVALLFTNVSGPRYLEDPDAETPTHHTHADLEVRDRQIDEVFSDSAFPPRWTLQK